MAKLRTELEKTIKAQKMMPLVMVVIGISTALQYAGIFSAGFLPPWVGILAIVLCVVQWPFLSRKIDRLEREIAGRR